MNAAFGLQQGKLVAVVELYALIALTVDLVKLGRIEGAIR